jgi:hypothetical protein
MQCARFVRTLGLLVVLGLAGSGNGCSPGSGAPMSQEESNQIRDSKKTAHNQLKADAKKSQQAGTLRRGAHRGR